MLKKLSLISLFLLLPACTGNNLYLRSSLDGSTLGYVTEDYKLYSPNGTYRGKEIDNIFYDNTGKKVGTERSDKFYNINGSYIGKLSERYCYNKSSRNVGYCTDYNDRCALACFFLVK